MFRRPLADVSAWCTAVQLMDKSLCEMAESSEDVDDCESVATGATGTSVIESRVRGWTAVLQCSKIIFENVEDVFEFFDRDTMECMAGQEEISENGFHHVQMYFKFKCTRKKHHVEAMFAKNGVPTITIQPFIGAQQAGVKYATKEATRVIDTEPFVWLTPDKVGKIGKPNAYAMALEATTREDALKIMREQAPREYMLNYKSIEGYLKRTFTGPNQTLYDMTAYNRVPLTFSGKKSGNCYVLYGESNLGKTGYAMAHFKHPLLVRHMDEISKITPEIDGIVFDDMSFRKHNLTTLLHLTDCEYEVPVNVKYSMGYIPVGMPRIFTINRMDDWWPFDKDEPLNESRKKPILNRVEIIEIDAPLFNNIVEDVVAKKTRVVTKTTVARVKGLERKAMFTDGVITKNRGADTTVYEEHRTNEDMGKNTNPLPTNH